MKKINFNVPDNQGFQLVDALYAYLQSLDPTFQAKYQFDYSSGWDSQADVNVLGLYMPASADSSIDLDLYDLILLNNGCEPTAAALPYMRELLLSRSNCYFIANSLTTELHDYNHKIIWWPALLMHCNDFWRQHFYPFLFNNIKSLDQPRTGDLTFINGRNDSWRHHMVSLLNNKQSRISIRSTITDAVIKIKDSQFESSHDSEFRETVNELYDCQDKHDEYKNASHSNSIKIGVGAKFGEIPPCFIVLPEYYTYRCVIFPETSWQNNEVSITEKICKCFYAETLPWPIGGANINQMYLSIGFYTAWNLLPTHLQQFDQTEDHLTRYQQLAEAISWLEQHPECLQSAEAKEMIQKNSKNFLIGQAELQCVEKFAKIVDRTVEQKGQR